MRSLRRTRLALRIPKLRPASGHPFQGQPTGTFASSSGFGRGGAGVRCRSLTRAHTRARHPVHWGCARAAQPRPVCLPRRTVWTGRALQLRQQSSRPSASPGVSLPGRWGERYTTLRIFVEFNARVTCRTQFRPQCHPVASSCVSAARRRREILSRASAVRRDRSTPATRRSQCDRGAGGPCACRIRRGGY